MTFLFLIYFVKLTYALQHDDITTFSENLLMYNNIKIPTLGFGTAAINKNRYNDIIHGAIENGFRLFDGAEANQWYDDERLGKALINSNLDRENQFIVTKILPINFGLTSTEISIKKALLNLQTDYIDLLLLHFPECWEGLCGNIKPEGTWKDAWKVLVKYLEAGIIKSIGVSNFNVDLIKEASKIYKPHAVQNWMDPFHKDTNVLEYCKKENIIYMGYSTLGGQWQNRGFNSNPVLNNEVLKNIAIKHNTNVVDVVLKWGIQRGTVVLPRSNSIKNIEKNGEIFNLFRNPNVCRENNYNWITEEDMVLINSLPEL